jgi:translocation protein SEC66
MLPIFSSSSLIPIAFLLLVLGSLIVFSIIIRRQKALEATKVEPWFPEHHQRNVYFTLLHMEDSVCPPKLLRAALLERAKENISRIHILRDSKIAAHELLRKGSISESLYQQIITAEEEMSLEMKDVIAEAKGLEGDEWGKTIIAQANEYYQKGIVLKTLQHVKEFEEREKEIWEKENALQKRHEQLRKTPLNELCGEYNAEIVGVADGSTLPKKEIPNTNGANSETSLEQKP